MRAALGGECPYGDKRLAQFAFMRKLDVKRAVDSGKGRTAQGMMKLSHSLRHTVLKFHELCVRTSLFSDSVADLEQQAITSTLSEEGWCLVRH